MIQLTIYLDENDTAGDQPLYEAVTRRLLHLQIAGATVLRGVMGYGHHGNLHRRHLLGIADDRPIVIVAIDEETKLRAVIPEIRAMVREGLVTLHPVEVV